MLVNSGLTVYHKVFNKETRLEEWKRYTYDNIWWFGGKGAGTNAGYDNANDVQIRIFYAINKNLNIEDFAIGDIIIQGVSKEDIKTQQDLPSNKTYNITSINNNNFGNNPHIHIGGK